MKNSSMTTIQNISFCIQDFNFGVKYLMTFSNYSLNERIREKKKIIKIISIWWQSVPSAPGGKEERGTEALREPGALSSNNKSKGGWRLWKMRLALNKWRGINETAWHVCSKRWGWWCCWWQHVFMRVYLGSKPHPSLKHLHLVMHGRKQYWTQPTHIKKDKEVKTGVEENKTGWGKGHSN